MRGYALSRRKRKIIRSAANKAVFVCRFNGEMVNENVPEQVGVPEKNQLKVSVNPGGGDHLIY
jgi:hypothetical protein